MQTKRGIILGVFLVSLILTVSMFVIAKPDFQAVNVNPSNGHASVTIPGHAGEVAPGVFSLGTAQDIDGRVVEGFMFIGDRRENAKPPWAGQGKGKGESKCYAFLAKGAKWKTTEQYITKGVDSTLTETSLNAWDSEVSFDIFGARDASGVVDGADEIRPDGKNEVELQNLGATSTIAYTIVWGIFSGPPRGRELVEWDAVFNSDYPWSLSGEAGEMDYQNIATHEFGHAVGLGHPEDTCTEETMYRFASFGETKKRTLEAGDIAGVNDLY
jgi:hypothetical protein